MADWKEIEWRVIFLHNGHARSIAMTRWHWRTYDWIVNTIGHPADDLFRSVERARSNVPYNQTLEWWIESYYEAREALENQGLAVTAD